MTRLTVNLPPMLGRALDLIAHKLVIYTGGLCMTACTELWLCDPLEGRGNLGVSAQGVDHVGTREDKRNYEECRQQACFRTIHMASRRSLALARTV